ncbi:LysM peptidoglycan-binding domain-containing protein [Flavobacterium sp. XGLA_31]|uniref:LysM peptidoglycan-binding domain-containing protein n=1 Tax=Flavobacterium sp. XGLA_31 TaxID=3447666 RepID=UPI003F330877
MKNRILFSILLTVFSFVVNASAMQEKYIKHTVVKGETVNSIAQKYKVTPFDIYKLNPDSQNGIQLNSVLLIPPSTVMPTAVKPVAQKQTGNPPTTHLVQPKETLYSIAKQFNITIEALKEANGTLLNNGLKIGQTIKIPAAVGERPVATVPTVEAPKEVVKEPVKEVVKEVAKTAEPKTETAFHVIEPKETKYGVSKRYGMTIEELEQLNPQILNGFPIGMKLKVAATENAVAETPVKTDSGTGTTTKPVVTPNASSGKKYLQEYVVRPNETISSIATTYGMSESELLELNPELKRGVKPGMILRVPIISKKELPKPDPVQGQGNLLKKLNTNARKQLALLLPFNINKIQSDTLNTTQERLKKDKFLNLTLDFYSGALMAIDSAKVLGLNVDIKILDSQETKSTSNVANLVTQENLGSMDAIIGPFYQSNAEKLAELVGATGTPVISPLSKESGKKYANLYQSMPTADLLRSSVFNYMRAKGGNIIAVIDPKKGSVKQYIQDMQKGVRVVGLNEKGGIVADSLKVRLQKDKLNYVVLASESTSMILATTAAMLAAQKEYQVQLVIMEPNETLDYEEIPLNRLTKLKMLYPSLSRPNETDEANQFDAKYKKLNKIIPNQYAIRGFDVTFDTLLRLSQDKPFNETVQTAASEQIENKFEYVANTTAGYSNKGIYILYYDDDLTIKEAL